LEGEGQSRSRGQKERHAERSCSTLLAAVIKTIED
jgi:hypothetical protein